MHFTVYFSFIFQYIAIQIIESTNLAIHISLVFGPRRMAWIQKIHKTTMVLISFLLEFETVIGLIFSILNDPFQAQR